MRDQVILLDMTRVESFDTRTESIRVNKNSKLSQIRGIVPLNLRLKFEGGTNV